MPQCNNSSLTVTVAGQTDLPEAGASAAVLLETIEILKILDQNISQQPTGTVTWHIASASLNSPLNVVLVPTPIQSAGFGEQAIRHYVRGVEAIERGACEIPRYFSDESLRRLARISQHFDDGIAEIRFADSAGHVAIATEMMRQNLERFHHKKASAAEGRSSEYFDRGVIEGMLETVTSHKGYGASLWDSVTGRRVPCKFGAALRDEVRLAWERRVAAYGTIRYSLDGRPLQLHIERITVLEQAEPLPLFEDERIDITGGLESSRYVRELRGDA